MLILALKNRKYKWFNSNTIVYKLELYSQAKGRGFESRLPLMF